MTFAEIILILGIAVVSVLAIEILSTWLGLKPAEQTQKDIEDRQW